MRETARVQHITRLRVNADGTGVRSVVFFYGCPLACFWCCNPETRFGADYRTLSIEELDACLKRDKPYFRYSGGGVTFSGGEPLLHASFIEAYVRRYGAGLSVDLETSLFAERAVIDRLLPLVDEWFVDVKVMNEEDHIRFTGQSNQLIRDNLLYLARKADREKIILTYPIIPGHNTSAENLTAMTAFMKSAGLSRISPHPYRKFAEEKGRDLGIPVTELPEVDAALLFSIEKHFSEAGVEIVRQNAVVEKDKCAVLKQIRRQICADRGVPLTIDDCTFEDRCAGTCPKCEAELDAINKYLHDEHIEYKKGDPTI